MDPSAVRRLKMERINLDNVIRVPAHHTSQGDQPKWEANGKWYKANHLGYESLSEVLVSRLLECSNASDFVRYSPVEIEIGGQVLHGCVSKNFRGKTEELIPLEKLHRAFTGRGLAAELATMSDTAERIKYTVEFLEAKTGLTGFGQYLTLLLELDAFSLNEDRHTNNIAVITDENMSKFRFCPIFDNGLALLADTNDYPLNEDVYNCIDRVKAKPFSQDFDEQAEAAAAIYGPQLHFFFDKTYVENMTSELVDQFSPNTLYRVKDVLLEQMRKYRVLF